MAKRGLFYDKRLRLIVVIVFIFSFLLLRGYTSFGLQFILSPMQIAGSTLVRSVHSALYGPAADRTEDLSKQLEALSLDHARLAALEHENEQLRKALDFVGRGNDEVTTASILSRSHSIRGERLVVNKGKQHGVRDGAAVFVNDGHLIGKVVSTRPFDSVIETLTYHESVVAASVINDSATIGSVYGVGETLLELKFVPQDQSLNVNDLVVTSGLEEDVPPGLVIGIINSVSDGDKEPFKSAIIEPLVDLREHHSVFIVSSPIL